MSTVIGDPAAMRAAAAQLRLRAETVGTVVAAVDGRVAAMTYAGPAADMFRNSITLTGTSLRTVSARMLDAADRLTREAAVVEALLIDEMRQQR